MITSRIGRDSARRLAGDEYTAIWARRRIRQQRLDVVRANARSFAAALITGVALLAPWRFVQGLVVGVGITALLSMIGFLVLALSGTMAPGMGATAETWTAGELRRLRRHGWRVINGLALPGRDVDHLLVGPAGVIVVETNGHRRTGTSPHPTRTCSPPLSRPSPTPGHCVYGRRSSEPSGR